MIKAALFDMDGLLTDTETLGIEVAIRVCHRHGFELNKMEQESFIGVTDEKFYQNLLERRGRSDLLPQVGKFLRDHFEEYEQLLKEGVRVFPGARELPKLLHKNGRRLALVSGSTAKQVGIILTQLGINDLFEVIVSADDITKSKPDPQGYLRAIQHLGIQPQECVIFEDAQTGVRAGKSTGAWVVGIVNKGGQDLTEADIVKANLASIDLPLIEKLGQ